MSGFFGFGQSGGEKASTAGINNIFNYSLPQAQNRQAAGGQNLNTADAYFKQLLGGGRTQAQANAAPVVNAAQDQTDAQRQQEAEQGTGRGGGTAGANREAGANTAKTVDDIINQNLVGGRAQAAQGETALGQTNLADAANLLGTAQKGQESLYEGAISKEAAQSSSMAHVLDNFFGPLGKVLIGGGGGGG